MTEHTRRVAILIGWVGVLLAVIALEATNAGSSVASGVAWGVGYLVFLATLFAGSLLFDRHRRKRS